MVSKHLEGPGRHQVTAKKAVMSLVKSQRCTLWLRLVAFFAKTFRFRPSLLHSAESLFVATWVEKTSATALSGAAAHPVPQCQVCHLVASLLFGAGSQTLFKPAWQKDSGLEAFRETKQFVFCVWNGQICVEIVCKALKCEMYIRGPWEVSISWHQSCPTRPHSGTGSTFALDLPPPKISGARTGEVQCETSSPAMTHSRRHRNQNPPKSRLQITAGQSLVFGLPSSELRSLWNFAAWNLGALLVELSTKTCRRTAQYTEFHPTETHCFLGCTACGPTQKRIFSW